MTTMGLVREREIGVPYKVATLTAPIPWIPRAVNKGTPHPSTVDKVMERSGNTTPAAVKVVVPADCSNPPVCGNVMVLTFLMPLPLPLLALVVVVVEPLQQSPPLLQGLQPIEGSVQQLQYPLQEEPLPLVQELALGHGQQGVMGRLSCRMTVEVVTHGTREAPLNEPVNWS